MKIEKLTENKIRVLLKNEDIKDKNIDLSTIMNKALESQSFFLEMLDQAEAEVGFNTDGCRLLIEAYSSPDNDFIFTITKYFDEFQNSVDKNPIPSYVNRKRVVPKRKKVDLRANCFIYSFTDFEAFCELCTCLNNSNYSIRGLARSICLYEYKNTYYLVIKDFYNDKACPKAIFSIISEFGRHISVSPSFENKLFEYGKIVIKHNALNTGIKYFA